MATHTLTSSRGSNPLITEHCPLCGACAYCHYSEGHLENCWTRARLLRFRTLNNDIFTVKHNTLREFQTSHRCGMIEPDTHANALDGSVRNLMPHRIDDVVTARNGYSLLDDPTTASSGYEFDEAYASGDATAYANEGTAVAIARDGGTAVAVSRRGEPPVAVRRT